MSKVLLKDRANFLYDFTVNDEAKGKYPVFDSNGIIGIKFHHRAVYQYFDVPEKVYKGFMEAASHESYFFNEIKEKYSYNKI